MTGAPTGNEPIRVAILTVSTSRVAEGGADESGEALVGLVGEIGGMLIERKLVADLRGDIEAHLRGWADGGGGGLGPPTRGPGLPPPPGPPQAPPAGFPTRGPPPP